MIFYDLALAMLWPKPQGSGGCVCPQLDHLLPRALPELEGDVERDLGHSSGCTIHHVSERWLACP